MIVASFDIGEKNFAYAVGSSDKLFRWQKRDARKKTIVDSCCEISSILHQEDWSVVDQVIIEQQMRTNLRAQRVAQHVWTWFHTLFPSTNPKFVSPGQKLKYFEDGVGLSNTKRKTWSVVKTRDILTEREDLKHLSYLDSLDKKDDVSDAFLQLIAFINK